LKDIKLKCCPKCSKWFTLRDIEESPEIEIIGMMLEPEEPSFNCYYFNHVCENCGTTFLIHVEHLEPLINEEIPEPIATGNEDCEGQCTDLENREECSNHCRYAPYRRLLKRLMDLQKSRSANRQPVPRS